jgi:hypothetical protein
VLDIEAALAEMVSMYIDASQAVVKVDKKTGKETYLPLGEAEIDALCRLYDVNLHTMTTEGIHRSLGWVTVAEMDPRAVLAKDVHQYNKASKRPVRLLNVNRHHYNVALPKSVTADAEAQHAQDANMNTSFNSFQYWSNDSASYFDEDDLPDL